MKRFLESCEAVILALAVMLVLAIWMLPRRHAAATPNQAPSTTNHEPVRPVLHDRPSVIFIPANQPVMGESGIWVGTEVTVWVAAPGNNSTGKEPRP